MMMMIKNVWSIYSVCKNSYRIEINMKIFRKKNSKVIKIDRIEYNMKDKKWKNKIEQANRLLGRVIKNGKKENKGA